MRSMPILALVCLGALTPAPGLAQDTPSEAPLPPPLDWSEQTRDLVVSTGDWVTPAEAADLARTPSYDETFAWLRRLVDATPQLEMISIGTSDEGRELWMVIASQNPATDPQALRDDGKPILFAHAGIHSGEIDGKDAGLMLLRDMTVRGTQRELLERANFLFVPILNVDGHERSSTYGRMNQRGPVEKGWRTNRRNLNLNRDFTKLETPGVRAVVEVINAWQPDLYLDLHVTDGVDYQYDITYGYNGQHSWSSNIARWLDGFYRPFVDERLTKRGHVPGPLIFGANWRDMYEGMYAWTGGPRFSNGYGDARHLPTVLLENHSLKPYDQRVLGTYVFLKASLEVLGQHHEELRGAVATDREQHADIVPLSWQVPDDASFDTIAFKGVRSYTELSPITGAPQVRWTGEPETIEIPVIAANAPGVTVDRPREYYIPAAWADIAQRLQWHGVAMERSAEGFTKTVRMYRLPDAALDAENSPFEGRARVTSGDPVVEDVRREFAPGSYTVSTEQPLSELVVLLLEPQSADSFFQWGYMLEILQRTEYFESYAMEPLAAQMLEADPELRTEFEQRLQNDSEFAGNGRSRLDFFYERTGYYDQEFKLYPIARSLD